MHLKMNQKNNQVAAFEKSLSKFYPRADNESFKIEPTCAEFSKFLRNYCIRFPKTKKSKMHSLL